MLTTPIASWCMEPLIIKRELYYERRIVLIMNINTLKVFMKNNVNAIKKCLIVILVLVLISLCTIFVYNITNSLKMRDIRINNISENYTYDNTQDIEKLFTK